MSPSQLDVDSFAKKLKASPDIHRAGMVLIHNGIVRASSKDGTAVTGIYVEADFARLEKILDEARKMPGIVAVEAEVALGRLDVGDDIMLLGVAGDIRENVIAVLSSTLNRIKAEVTSKKEIKA